MRLGEIKQILDKVLDDNNKIILNHKAIYNGQQYIIENYKKIMDALEILNELTWNKDTEKKIYIELEESYERITEQQLSPEEYTQLNIYISKLNARIPIYYSILETQVDKQDEKTINIKLPNYSTLKDLNDFNNRIETMLKLFNVDGKFVFEGFDVGTSWYKLVTKGIMTCYFLIACLKVGQEACKLMKDYSELEILKKSYLLLEKNYNNNKFEEHIKNLVNQQIEKQIQSAIKNIGTNGHSEEELKNKLIKATNKLIIELNNGTEFHLSLNPPKYASEEQGQISVNYEELKKLMSEKEHPLQIEGDKKLEKSDG